MCAGVSAARGAGHIPAVAHAHSSQLSGAIQRHGLHQNVGETSPPGCTFAYHVNLATYYLPIHLYIIPEAHEGPSDYALLESV